MAIVTLAIELLTTCQTDSLNDTTIHNQHIQRSEKESNYKEQIENDDIFLNERNRFELLIDTSKKIPTKNDRRNSCSENNRIDKLFHDSL